MCSNFVETVVLKLTNAGLRAFGAGYGHGRHFRPSSPSLRAALASRAR